MIKSNVQIDWLSISCLGIIKDFSNLIPKVEQFQTRQFKTVTTCYLNSFEFCTITSEPHSSVLNELLIIIKLYNRFLYSTEYHNIIKNLIEKNDLKKIHISRIDLCIDFQTFEKNRKPEKFISDFVSERILKVGKSKFSLHGETNDNVEFQYISFGSKSSNVNCYLYNKSLEMNQVKWKDWISEKWSGLAFDKRKDIWRLEFSLKNINYSLIQDITGEIFKIDLDFIKINWLLHDLFFLLVQNYFLFKQNSNDSNKSRLKPIILFNDTIESYHRMKLSEAIESNRLDKYLLKRLDLMFSELREDDIELYENCENIKEIFMKKKCLQKHYFEKIEPVTAIIKKQPYVFGNEYENNEQFVEMYKMKPDLDF